MSSRSARIKSLSIRAFKSFGADVQRFNFDKGFNLVVGANGSGKSNILDAICFALCSKPSALRVGSISELQSTDTKESCEVSLELETLGPSGEEADLINMSVRILPNDVRQYKINGKLKSVKEIKDMLKEHRLLLDETSAVVHQSSVTELADRNSPFKLSSIISSASGAGRWNEEVETATKELKSTRAGLDEIQENISLLESSIMEDNARLKKLLRAEQLVNGISYATKQIVKFQAQKLQKVRAVISEKEEEVKSKEVGIEEWLLFVKDKRSVLNEHKRISRGAARDLNIEKNKILDIIAMREEEIAASESQLKEGLLLKDQLESAKLVAENLKMEMSVLKNRLEEKQSMVERLEVKSTNLGRADTSNGSFQRYKDELSNNLKVTKLKLKNLNIEETNLQTSLQGAEKALSYWETHWQSRKEEQTKLAQFKETCDLHAIGMTQEMRKQCLGLKRSIEDLQTQSQILCSELGSLSLEEAALPAWPLHSCFTFKSGIEDMSKYMKALNVIAGFMKRVCVTETTNAAANLLQMRENSGNTSTFCRIWPLDRLKCSDDIRHQRNIQSLYPKGSVVLPMELLQFDQRFKKVITRAFGTYVISLSDDVGCDLAVRNKVWNVTLDGRVNRTGSVSGGWRSNENNSYLHLKLQKEKTDQELASLVTKQSKCEKDIKELEKVALEYGACKSRTETVLKDILLAEDQIKSLKKEVTSYQTQLQHHRKLIAFAQRDAETTEKTLASCVDDLDSKVGLEYFKDALNNAKAEKGSLVEALERLQAEVEEAQAGVSVLAHKVSNLKTEDLRQSVESKAVELQGLKANLSQIEAAMEQVAHEESLRTEMMVRDQEAIDNAEKCIEEMKSEVLKLQKEVAQMKREEEKIGNDLQELPTLRDDEAAEVHDIKDVHSYAIAKHNLNKMAAELNQLRSEQQGMSLAEQVAIKERADKLQVFKERRGSIIDSIDILLEGIEKSKKRVQEANEVVFQKVCQAFSETCEFLLPNKLVKLIKVGTHVEDGVKFTFANQSSGAKTASNKWKTSLGELSGGQRTLLSLAFLLTVAISGQSPLYLLDEVDAALDEENQNRVAKLIKNIVSKGSQVASLYSNCKVEEALPLMRVEYVLSSCSRKKQNQRQCSVENAPSICKIEREKSFYF
ncbi:hypothetical protein GOP47_0005214 [Adiantum capillus-veneris]|uniref:RecF/RecN/SMC N-terminal domain-containing protein n=1 Tax=Adiantum capillus-veneris TaxID=13818 RepID=A0A9D4ZNY1_ADICA|nr:hypothetical protein GOP47_0005214 [Adiantum capillus-veneris]